MKYFILCFSLLLTTNAFAQKKVELRFITDGVCGMCENRIEKTLLNLRGVWTAEWDLSTHETFVVYNTKKITENKIHEALSHVGHDQICSCTESKILAFEESYNNINLCCRYRDRNVIEAHK